MNEIIISGFGYLAAICLAVALFINQTLRFRWVNTCGNVLFISYGVLIHSFPVMLTNLILLSINIYKLIRIYNLKEVFEFMEFKKGNPYVEKFLSFYKEDIQIYFPDFNFNDDTNRICFMVYRDLVTANIFIGRISENQGLIVEINYTVPKYRDYKVGKFIFDKGKDFLLAKGINRISYRKMENKQHLSFLKKLGFISMNIDGKNCYSKGLLEN